MVDLEQWCRATTKGRNVSAGKPDCSYREGVVQRARTDTEERIERRAEKRGGLVPGESGRKEPTSFPLLASSLHASTRFTTCALYGGMVCAHGIAGTMIGSALKHVVHDMDKRSFPAQMRRKQRAPQDGEIETNV